METTEHMLAPTGVLLHARGCSLTPLTPIHLRTMYPDTMPVIAMLDGHKYAMDACG